ncbi:hypothetical protein Tco_0683796 [Tanacetum coccineum]
MWNDLVLPKKIILHTWVILLPVCFHIIIRYFQSYKFKAFETHHLDALCAVKFPLLAQLESHKDAKMADLFDLLRLEGPVAGLPGSSQLQPSVKQLTVPIHRLEDQRLKGNVAACCLSLSDVVVPLVEPLSAKILVGEASSSMIPSVTATTALATTFASVSATKVPPSDVVFEEEELDTTPEHALVS